MNEIGDFHGGFKSKKDGVFILETVKMGKQSDFGGRKRNVLKFGKRGGKL